MGTKFVEEQFHVTEHFYSLQGEGAYSGRAAYFIRLAGCNVGCEWCDSKNSWKMSSAAVMTTRQILDTVEDSGTRIVVITGGEPMLHNLEGLTDVLHKAGLRVHLETSGSEPFTGNFDWITLSPKKKKECLADYFKKADELKVIIQREEDFERAKRLAEKVDEKCLLLLQCEWGSREEMMPKIVEFIKKNSNWGLSLQTHKFIGVE